jgi:hypothetical protein
MNTDNKTIGTEVKEKLVVSREFYIGEIVVWQEALETESGEFYDCISVVLDKKYDENGNVIKYKLQPDNFSYKWVNKEDITALNIMKDEIPEELKEKMTTGTYDVIQLILSFIMILGSSASAFFYQDTTVYVLSVLITLFVSARMFLKYH